MIGIHSSIPFICNYSKYNQNISHKDNDAIHKPNRRVISLFSFSGVGTTKSNEGKNSNCFHNHMLKSLLQEKEKEPQTPKYLKIGRTYYAKKRLVVISMNISDQKTFTFFFPSKKISNNVEANTFPKEFNVDQCVVCHSLKDLIEIIKLQTLRNNNTDSSKICLFNENLQVMDSDKQLSNYDQDIVYAKISNNKKESTNMQTQTQNEDKTISVERRRYKVNSFSLVLNEADFSIHKPTIHIKVGTLPQQKVNTLNHHSRVSSVKINFNPTGATNPYRMFRDETTDCGIPAISRKKDLCLVNTRSMGKMKVKNLDICNFFPTNNDVKPSIEQIQHEEHVKNRRKTVGMVSRMRKFLEISPTKSDHFEEECEDGKSDIEKAYSQAKELYNLFIENLRMFLSLKINFLVLNIHLEYFKDLQCNYLFSKEMANIPIITCKKEYIFFFFFSSVIDKTHSTILNLISDENAEKSTFASKSLINCIRDMNKLINRIITDPTPYLNFLGNIRDMKMTRDIESIGITSSFFRCFVLSSDYFNAHKTMVDKMMIMLKIPKKGHLHFQNYVDYYAYFKAVDTVSFSISTKFIWVKKFLEIVEGEGKGTAGAMAEFRGKSKDEVVDKLVDIRRLLNIDTELYNLIIKYEASQLYAIKKKLPKIEDIYNRLIKYFS